MPLTIEEQDELSALDLKLAEYDYRIKQAAENQPSKAKETAMAIANTVIDAGMESGGAALGAGIGAFPLFSIPTAGLSIPIGAGLGATAGYLAKEYGRGREPTAGGATEALVMGATPIPKLAGAGVAEVAKAATKQAASSLAGTTARTLMDEGRLPTAKEAGYSAGGAVVGTVAAKTLATDKLTKAQEQSLLLQKQQQDTNDALRMWQALGGVVDPVQTNPSAITKAIERTGNKTIIAGESTLKNTLVSGDIARAEIGMAADSPLTYSTLKQLAKDKSKVYEEVATINKSAEALLDVLGKIREKARDYWKEYGSTNSVFAKQNAVKLQDKAKALEAQLDSVVKQKSPTLMEEFLKARQTLSKIHVVEDALTGPETGIINPAIIGAIHKNNPELLTGGLKAIGSAANIQPQIMGPFVRLPSGSSNYVYNSAVIAGLGLANTPLAAAMAGGAASRASGLNPATMFATSNAYQKIMGVPRYDTQPTQKISDFFQRMSTAAGQQLSSQQPSSQPQ